MRTFDRLYLHTLTYRPASRMKLLPGIHCPETYSRWFYRSARSFRFSCWILEFRMYCTAICSRREQTEQIAIQIPWRLTQTCHHLLLLLGYLSQALLVLFQAMDYQRWSFHTYNG